ncbi:MAG TPA: TonB-dependent receptor [Sphingomicrobium sp.]|nr:TonB-dependent receptor [Sphingomicrobium sp.]
MVPLLLFLAEAAIAADRPEIVITASRAPVERSETPASATVIDEERIERLGDALASSLLRLTPSASVETGGPAGTLAQVRIRGAEASHTLLFIDGIRANDPAAGDIPRFELLNADIVSRIEIVRGPQSALWGADAIGGVVAINGLAPDERDQSLSAEAGSFGFARAAGSAAIVSGTADVAVALGWQRATGIDSFDGAGDKDGYRNLSGRLRGTWAFAPGWQAGAAGFALSGRSEFDGFDPQSFRRADTLDSTENTMAAARLWVSGGDRDSGLSGTVAASILGSSNRNFVGSDEINRTRGERWTVNGQLQHRFATAGVRHTAILALEHGREAFRARDTIFFGATNQDRERDHRAVTAQWRAELAPVVADLAVRRDLFSEFEDATTLRASALVRLGGGFALAGSYSEGIAQPSFFDLFGFFSGSFVGNPALKPESSRGYELSLRFRRGTVAAAVTGFRQRLFDEIIDLFDPSTFQSTTANRQGSSRRSGFEAEIGWDLGERLRATASYAFLDASEPAAVPSVQLREVRRPRHSASLALDGRDGRLTYGAALTYTGARSDMNFDVFPAQRLRLKPYWLAGARLAWALRPGLEIFARATNIFDERYQDVFGYRTEGRAAYAGVKLGGR